MEPFEYYLTYIHKKINYRGAWFPDDLMQPGAIGTLDKGVFTAISTLEEQGIEARFEENQSDLSLDLSSGDGLAVHSNLSTSLPAGAQAGVDGKISVTIEATADRGILFQSAGFTKVRVANLGAVTNAVLPKYSQGTWQKEWLILTEILKTPCATIIISTSRNSSMQLEGSGEAKLGDLQLADSRLGLGITGKKGDIIGFAGRKNMTPLYKVMGVQDPFWGNPSLKTRSVIGSEEPGMPDALAGGDKEMIFSERKLDDREFY
jgi:hypothetical protein